MSENYNKITAEVVKDAEGRTIGARVAIHSSDGTAKTAAISLDGAIIVSAYDTMRQSLVGRDTIYPACWSEKAAISPKPPVKRFIPPTIEKVREYCKERGNRVDPVAFVSFYESNGWKVGRNAMKDWRAAVRTWEQREGRAKCTNSGARNTNSGAKSIELPTSLPPMSELEKILARKGRK